MGVACSYDAVRRGAPKSATDIAPILAAWSRERLHGASNAIDT